MKAGALKKGGGYDFYRYDYDYYRIGGNGSGRGGYSVVC
jgi:hypothetical protein